MTRTTTCLEPSVEAQPENDLRLEHLRRRRRRHPVWRLMLANVWDVRLLLHDTWLSLLGCGLICLIGTFYLRLGYHDYANSGVHPFTFSSAMFEIMRMLVLQSALPLPSDGLFGPLLFFTVPIFGLALLAQSALNFGRLLLDKGSRLEAWQLSLASTYRGHVIVCGLGQVSYCVILELLESGSEVVAVERDWNSEFVQAMLALKVPVVKGDARDPDLLAQAGLPRARSLVAAVNDDLVNIEISLAAKRRCPQLHVVLRIFNDELDTHLESYFGPDTAFNSSELAAPTLAVAAVSRGISCALPVARGVLGVSALTIGTGSRLAGSARQIEKELNAMVVLCLDTCGRQRRDDAPLALETGDKVFLIGSLDALEEARRQNEHGGGADVAATANRYRPTGNFDTVIVCGLGSVGYRVVKTLHLMRPRPEIVVVCGEETHHPFLADVRRLGIRQVTGDARREDVLRDAGIGRAYSVAAITSDDLVNLQIGLAARHVRPGVHLVLRAFSDVLAERLAALFGIHTAFSAAALAAPTLAAATAIRGIDHAIEIQGRLFATDTVIVQPQDRFAGHTVGDARQQHQTLALSIRQKETSVLLPGPDVRLKPGDEIVILADVAVLSATPPSP